MKNSTINIEEVLKQIAYRLDHEQDMMHRNQMLDLIQKWNEQELTIAFCGHFSAGKSSLINALFGQNLLPTSPIPTSANVVKVKRGEDRIVVRTQDGKERVFTGTDGEKEMERFARDGAQIAMITISREDTPLPEGISLIDTPGIDSTDEAHQLATERALHLADQLLYVMDYHHVQSEVNHQFLKELAARGKKFCLVVHQIDKHQEEELPFSVYRQELETSFRAWEIPYQRLFTTSLRENCHVENQLQELQKWVKQLLSHKDELIQQSLQIEQSQIIERHLHTWEKEHIPEEALEEDISLRELNQEQEQLAREKAELEQLVFSQEKRFQEDLDSLLKSAYLMPFAVRELAGSYLEAMQPTFQVGFWRRKQKTEAERQKRLHAFHSKYVEVVQSQLETHVKQLLIDAIERLPEVSNQLRATVYQLPLTVSAEELSNWRKEGIGFSGNAVLNYTEDISQETKKKVKQLVRHFWTEHVQDLWQEEQAERQKNWEKKAFRLKELVAKIEEREKYRQKLLRYRKTWEQLAQGKWEMDPAEVNKWYEKVQKEQLPQVWELTEIDVPVEKEAATDVPTEVQAKKVARTLEEYQSLEEEIEKLPVLSRFATDLRNKRKRLENKQFLVALFGAFSAGKSSFANAISGIEILPVSPHPTTATITQILPPTEEYPDGTALVYFQSEEGLLSELQRSLEPFRLAPATLPEAIKEIRKVQNRDRYTSLQKMNLPFLIAVEKHFSAMQERLGERVSVDQELLREYVAKEETSCFIERVEIYRDTPLTRRGILLVDTPGADSIHSRHTELAFRYMKEADALFFVTYYTHAFSRADQELLLQMGRVRSAWEMDKMFFLVNAADLAQTEQELTDVCRYVSDQLRQFGIRDPRLFPVSSKNAMIEKKRSSSGLPEIEAELLSYLEKDLSQVTLAQMETILEQTKSLISDLLARAQRGKQEQEAELKRVALERREVNELIKKRRFADHREAMRQELNELFYYVKQRILLRLRDEAKEVFHPSVLSKPKEVRKQLLLCLEEIIQFMRNEWLQELRATSLRLSTYMAQLFAKTGEQLIQSCEEKFGKVPFVWEIGKELPEPKIANAWKEIDPKDFRSLLPLFRNPRAFFEQNEKEKFIEHLLKMWEERLTRELEREKERLLQHFDDVGEQHWSDIQENAAQQVKQYYTELLAGGDLKQEEIKQLKQLFNIIS